MSDTIEQIHLTALRNRASSNAGMRPVEQFEVLALLDEIERLHADIKAINPAIKCRSGCHVVKERFGETS